MVLRRSAGHVSTSFGVERNGDLDITVSISDAQRLRDALGGAAGLPH